MTTITHSSEMLMPKFKKGISSWDESSVSSNSPGLSFWLRDIH